jgi:hypothetical protein
MDDREHARRAGPTYIHRLQAACPADLATMRCRGTIAVVLLDLGRAVTLALRRALRTAVGAGSAVYVLHFVQPNDRRPAELLTWSREFGDRLTTAVLRLARGRLPPLVTVVVYQGTREDAGAFVASSIRPDIVLATHRHDDPPSAALAYEITRRQDCPVLLVHDSGRSRRRRLPSPRVARALN